MISKAYGFVANILYLSCHSILEYDETKLLTELGHNVLSLGAYQNPQAPQDVKRPSFKGFYDDHLQAVAIQCSKENLHEELIDWADIILIMHKPEWVINNWPRIKHKRVIWRSIGQSMPDIENQLATFRIEGLQIIRYSPQEKTIPGFAGEDVVIRFYKDPEEFSPWGDINNKVLNVTQSFKKRGMFCGFEIFDEATKEFPRVVYGPDNEDIPYNGGLLTYPELKNAYKNHRVYFYTGTYPASYTLNFIEAFMTGIPIVAIGKDLADLDIWKMDTYEVDKIITDGKNGFIGNNIAELREYVRALLNDEDLRKRIGKEGRKTAIELFGKDTVKKQWEAFL